MKWTTAQPTKTGWYYLQRMPEGEREFPIRVQYVGEQYFPFVDKTLLSLFEFHPDYLDAKDRPPYGFPLCELVSQHRFAGPLEEPEE